jgi:hypothetical protein
MIDEIGATKTAAAKRAETLSETGSIGGTTSHPSKSIEDGLQSATEGARSSENAADAKKITGTPDATSDTINQNVQSEANKDMGTSQSMTGEAPSVEDAFKGNKDDGSIGGSTSHPATTEDGEKYGSWNFAKTAAHSNTLANTLLSEIAAGKYSDTPGTKQAAAVANPVIKAAHAGYDAAAAIANQAPAVDNNAETFIRETVKEANDSAVLAYRYLTNYFQAVKQASPDADDAAAPEGEGAPPTDPAAEGGAGGGEGSAPPPGGGGEGGGGDIAGMLGAMAPPEAGGAGGMPGDGAPGAGAPAASNDEVLNELINIMMEMGISPEELVAKLSAGGGAPPADPMGGAGGAPPMGPGPAGDAGAMLPKAAGINAPKLLAKIAEHRRSGKFVFGPPKTARDQALRSHMRSFVVEAVNRK